MRKSLTTLVTASALVFVLAACGDDGGSDSADDEGDTTSTDQPVTLDAPLNDEGQVDIGDDSTVDIDAVDNAFGPTFVKATSGSEVQVTIENAGDVTHTFTIDGQDVDVELQPGDTSEATVTLPDGEALRFFCTIHESQGMQGAFYSEDGQAVVGVSGGASSPDSTTTTSGGSPGGYGY
jgi:plastocyanin